MVSLALVHERFTDFAGSELVVQQFSRIWPNARILAPIVDPAVVPADMTVQAGGLNHLYRGGGYAYLLPLLPRAMRTLPVPPTSGNPLLGPHRRQTAATGCVQIPR